MEKLTQLHKNTGKTVEKQGETNNNIKKQIRKTNEKLYRDRNRNHDKKTNRILYRKGNQLNLRQELQQNCRETETDETRRKVDMVTGTKYSEAKFIY